MTLIFILRVFQIPFLGKDRNCFGGGVLVYTSRDICVKERRDLSFEEGELIWFELVIPNSKMLACAVYRSPGSDNSFWEKFENAIEQALIILKYLYNRRSQSS